MIKYKKTNSIELKWDVTYVIPHNAGVDESATVTRVHFKRGHTVGFIKRELIKVLRALGLDPKQAVEYLKKAFPELY